KDKFLVADEAAYNFKNLLEKVCEDKLKTISNVKSLIKPLSIIAKEVRKKSQYLLDGNEDNFSSSEKISAEYLKMFRNDFRASIFKEEVENENKMFSDLYAQTIVYGAFSAWIKFCEIGNSSKNFTIQIVGDYLPFGSFLRDLFLQLKNKTPKEFQTLLNQLETKFQHTEYKPIINNSETLITTFYSDFLKFYDPQTSKDRGVIYTPHEIVEFMINGIDFILKKWLNQQEGIINSSTNVGKYKPITRPDKIEKNDEIDRLRFLDPAAGTMAFASGLLHKAKERFSQKFPNQSALGNAAFGDWVKTEFFPNMYAFEILMAPYVLGHIRVFLTLEQLGQNLSTEDNRLKSFLMNTLMTPPDKNLDNWIFQNQEIGNEIKEALKIRDHQDIYVIMGNPPYNLSSQNDCEWINQKIFDYKRGLKEKNKKILSDDYVKFIRFAQWKIEQVGKGIIAFITNNKYLDGQMFSVMRKSLRNTFDHIYIVNLHGDMRKNESGNPFNIRVGVCIAFMVRIDNSPNKKAKIHYLDIPENDKTVKFAKLSQGFQDSKFSILSETPKNYFIEMDTTYLKHYESFTPINFFFKRDPTSGIMAGKDHLVMDTDIQNLKESLGLFFSHNYEQLDQWKIKTNDSKSWQKAKVFKGTSFEKSIAVIRPILYRGFDFRYITYDRSILEGHRMGYIDQISPENPAITVTKASRKKTFCSAFIADKLIEKCFMSVTDTAYAFILKNNGESNIIKPDLGFSYSDEDLFYYIYGILFSSTYRKRYDIFLRKSYPGIPLTSNQDIFQKMAQLGQDLAETHLLHVKININFEISDIPQNEWKVEKITFSPEKSCLFLDSNAKSIWIKGITQEIWDYSIGTIPQLNQFLKSRRFNTQRKWNTLQRALTYEELTYFLKMCSAIEKSIAIEKEIDDVYCRIDNLI
ncbi:MAG: type ISP restriction/modification enzyme, partial [Promethearchaeota archaeon]